MKGLITQTNKCTLVQKYIFFEANTDKVLKMLFRRYRVKKYKQKSKKVRRFLWKTLKQ